MASKAFSTREQRLQQDLLARPAADTDAASDGRACERCQSATGASGEACEHGCEARTMMRRTIEDWNLLNKYHDHTYSTP